MRLSQSQLDKITQTTTAVAGPLARVSIFGSRLDDSRVGGDVDLLIESKPAIGLLVPQKSLQSPATAIGLFDHQ
jgi:predicted nucleotidyltransferase